VIVDGLAMGPSSETLHTSGGLGPTFRRQVEPRQRTPPAATVASGSGQNRPPSALPRALAIGVSFVKELPAGRAEVLSINGSVGAHGGPAFFKNHEALSAAYRHTR
jgi:hypothetical protein